MPRPSARPGSKPSLAQQLLHCCANEDEQRDPTLPSIVQDLFAGADGQVIWAGHKSVVPLQLTSHLHELPHATLPQAGPSPMQPTWQAPPPHVIAPQAALPPPQVALQVPIVPHVMSLQALLPVQLAVQVPSPQISLPQTWAPLPPEQVSVHVPVVHEMLPHAALPVQVASQVPVVHEMLPHAALPVQVSLQSLVPHVMFWHALDVHAISHDAALLQLIAPHAPAVGHVMLQCQPGGHVMLPLPVPVIVQVDVPKSHMPPQTAGHTAASGGRASSSGLMPITQ